MQMLKFRYEWTERLKNEHKDLDIVKKRALLCGETLSPNTLKTIRDFNKDDFYGFVIYICNIYQNCEDLEMFFQRVNAPNNADKQGNDADDHKQINDASKNQPESTKCNGESKKWYWELYYKVVNWYNNNKFTAGVFVGVSVSGTLLACVKLILKCIG